MKIKQLFDCVDGDFDTDDGKLSCVRMKDHRILMCFKEGMNIPFGRIRLYDSDLYRDAEATSDDAYALGNEIARRWNENARITKQLAIAVEALEAIEMRSLFARDASEAELALAKIKEVE